MFSKLLVIIIAILAILTTVFAAIMMVITKDLSPLHVLVPAVFGQFGIAAGFYFNKAKAENKFKLRGWNELDNPDLEDDLSDGRG